MQALDRAAQAVGGLSKLASLISVSASLPNMWKARENIPPEHCAAIERACGKAVMRWELRPDDWHRIWPELIGTPGAPAAPVEATAEEPEAKAA